MLLGGLGKLFFKKKLTFPVESLKQIVEHPCNEILATKKELLILAVMWMNLKSIMLHERIQNQTRPQSIATFI